PKFGSPSGDVMMVAARPCCWREISASAARRRCASSADLDGTGGGSGTLGVEKQMVASIMATQTHRRALRPRLCMRLTPLLEFRINQYGGIDPRSGSLPILFQERPQFERLTVDA